MSIASCQPLARRSEGRAKFWHDILRANFWHDLHCVVPGENVANFATFFWPPGKMKKSGVNATFATFLVKIAAQRKFLKNSPFGATFATFFGHLSKR